MKRFFKNSLFFLLPKKRLQKNQASILMYHSVSPNESFATVTPYTFQKQMKYLYDAHIPIISLKELVRRLQQKESLEGAVILTFDDGYADNYEYVFPILKKFRFPATVFVTSNFIGMEEKDHIYLSIEQLEEMEKSGLIDIEPHTASHTHLSKVPLLKMEQEILNSKMTLEQGLSKQCVLFAYPYGDYNDTVVEEVKKNGFVGAVTVKEGIVSFASDLFRLSRNSIDSTTTFIQFKGKISYAIVLYEKLKKKLPL